METPAKIMIIEDSIVSAMMMEATINRKKPEFEVLVMKTLQGGLDALATFSPNIVILDLCLPDSPDGKEACAAIRMMRERGHCVIGVSGLDGIEVDARECGANDFIAKPFGEDSHPFLERIMALLPECL